jgi:hypothetical protein
MFLLFYGASLRQALRLSGDGDVQQHASQKYQLAEEPDFGAGGCGAGNFGFLRIILAICRTASEIVGDESLFSCNIEQILEARFAHR